MRTYQELILDMGRSDKQEIASRINVVIQNMAKLAFVPDPIRANDERGWKKTVRDQQVEIEKVLIQRPSLKPQLTQDRVIRAYAANVAELRTQYPQVQFPSTCPFTLKAIVGDGVMRLLQK